MRKNMKLNTLVDYLRRYVPRPVRKVLLAPPYNLIFNRGIGIVWDDRLLHEVMEYLQLGESEAIHMCKLLDKPNAMLWAALDPKTDEQIQRFYATTPFYICELAYWHMQVRQRKFRDNIVKISSGDVLDYGGGIGDLCVRLAEKGLDVTYADIQGKTFQFAQWLFRKRGLKIETIDLNKEKLFKKYDEIICLDVLEHIPQAEAVLEDIVGHIKENGRLIITIPRGEEVYKYPLHLNPLYNKEQLLSSLGLLRTDKEWVWVKPGNGNGALNRK